MGWGTAQKFYSYNRKCQSWVGWEQTGNTATSATIKISGCARSGDGSGYYYAYDFGVTVKIFWRIGGGSWNELKSTTTSLNYGNEVGNISASVTIDRTHATQVLTIACDAISRTGDWPTATAQMSININPKTSYAIALDANKPSAAAADVANMPANQTKWHGEALTLPGSSPSLSLYAFKGWNTAAAGTGTSYAAGGTYPASSNAAATLYAQWELAYAYPTISSPSVVRSNSSGTRSEDGKYAKVAFGWSVDATANSGANKGKRYEIAYRAVGATSWTTAKSQTVSTTSGNVSVTVGSGTLSTASSYDFRISVTDTHTIGDGECTSYVYLTLSQSFVHLTGNPNHGVAVGMQATAADTFEVALDTKLDAGFEQANGTVTLDATSKAAWLAALGPLFHFEEVTTATQSIASGSVVEFTATAPTISGWTCKGALQAWASGTGTTIVGMPWRSSSDNVMHVKARGNVASSVRVSMLLLYTPDALTT